MQSTGQPQWPLDKDGFRQRGLEMTRIETFTDAAFAFAVSLLVISTQSVPTSYDELINAILGLPAFAVTFLLVMSFWYGHWQWSRRFGLEDKGTIVLSCALVFLTMTYVYPLKFVVALAARFYSRDRLSYEFVFPGLDQLYDLFAIYGLGYAAMAGSIALLNGHALRRRDELQLDEREIFITRSTIGAWIIVASVGAACALMAFVAPVSPFVWPVWTFLLLPVVMPLYGRHYDQRIKRFAKEMAASEAGSGPAARP
jgi:uncharacterized membrane protein